MPEGIRRKGFPAPAALAAAAILHAAILALVLPWPVPPQRLEAGRPVAVTLVLAPPRLRQKPPPVPKAAPPASQAAPPAPPASVAPAPAAQPGSTAQQGLQQLAQAPPSAAENPEPERLDAAKMPPAAKDAAKLGKRQNKSAKRREATGAGARVPGAAVYGVVLAAAGNVDSITLLQSSGRSDFDAAGEQMVRRRLRFPGPQAADGATRYFTVTLRFTPARH